MYSVQCTVYNVRCTVYQCTVYSEQCVMCIMYLKSVQWRTESSVQCYVSSCKVLLEVKSLNIIAQFINLDDSGDAVVAC